MKCFRRLFGISYKKNHITNEEVKKNRIKQPSGLYEDLLSTINRRKTNMVRPRDKRRGTCKDSSTGNSERRKKERKTKEEMGRQHRRMDWTEAERNN